MHTARCDVCKSEYCKDIETAFVAWEVPREIGKMFGVSGDSVERHAKAMGFKDKRDKNLRGALTQIINCGMLLGAPVKPETIVSAIKLGAQLDGDFVEKHEERHTHDVSKSMRKRLDNLVVAIGGLPDGVKLASDTSDE